MKKEQFEAITLWQKQTFGQATPLSKLAHLKQEIEELEKDIISGEPKRHLEYADCFFLLFGCAAADGLTYEAIISSIDEKFSINKDRKWGKPDENGVVNHIKP